MEHPSLENKIGDHFTAPIGEMDPAATHAGVHWGDVNWRQKDILFLRRI